MKCVVCLLCENGSKKRSGVVARLSEPLSPDLEILWNEEKTHETSHLDVHYDLCMYYVHSAHPSQIVA